MKLNPDCLRDILLYIEETTDLDTHVIFEPNNLPSELLGYPPEEVMYHIKQSQLADLIVLKSWFVSGSCLVRYLTPEGHKFISNIKNDSIWAKTKEISKSMGTISISLLTQIASNVAVSVIQSHL